MVVPCNACEGSSPAMRVIGYAGRDALAAGDAAAVRAAARAGGVILFPTDTLYGLGADPRSTGGLAAIFRIKGRGPDRPLPVLLADASLVVRYAAAVPGPWRSLMERFWPGPLTLLFPALPGLPRGICSSSGKVALRVPGSTLCRSVLEAAGGSLTGTSANVSGAGGTGDPDDASRGLESGIALFVNAGTLPPSPPSTILEVDESGGVRTVRGGAVLEADLLQVFHEAKRRGDVS